MAEQKHTQHKPQERPPVKFDKLIDNYVNAIEFNQNKPNTNVEFEVRFGNKPHYITATQQENIIRSIKRIGFELSESSHYLNITFVIHNRSKDPAKPNKPLFCRITLDNIVDIQNYCKTDELPKNPKILIKKNASIRGGPKDKTPVIQLKPEYNNDFNYRSSIQIEHTLTPSDKIYAYIIANWHKLEKDFRYITRYSYEMPLDEDETEDDKIPLRIDISRVRSSKNKGYKFSESGTISSSNNLSYEVEMEVMNKSLPEHVDKDSLLNQLKLTTKYIIMGIQDADYPITYKEQSRVLQQYTDLIYSSSNIPKDKQRPVFIGPSSLTLQQTNLIDVTPLTTAEDDESKAIQKSNAVSIVNDFCVTDKADGIRKLLFINERGIMYMITMNLEVQFTGVRVNHKQLINTIIDGEFIRFDSHKRVINQYAAFDLYFNNGRDIRNIHFMSEISADFYPSIIAKKKIESDKKGKKLTSRYDSLKYITMNIHHHRNRGYKLAADSESVQDDKMSKFFNIRPKTFINANTKKQETIHRACVEAFRQNNSLSYNVDGLIFTHKYLGVGCETFSDHPKNYKYTWKNSFKWKPPEYNTIDFLIKLVRNPDGSPQTKYITTMTTNGSNITEYYIVHLYVGMDKSVHGYVNGIDTLMNMEYRSETYGKLDKDKKERSYKPQLFYPTNPSSNTAHIAYIKVKKNDIGSSIMTTEEDGQVINDDTIVEFSYDTNEPSDMLSWKPLRNRSDKTLEYKVKHNNFGNAYHVANQNWYSIKNPVTEDMLTSSSGVNINELIESDVYYNTNNNTKKDSKTKGLRRFHNIGVKNAIIKYASDSAPDFNHRNNSIKTLVDLAVGKAGDLNKWVTSGIDFVFGIDKSSDNIYNPIDGAIARFLNTKESRSDQLDAVFTQGDTSQLLSNGNFFSGIDKSDEDINDGDITPNTYKDSLYILKSLRGQTSNTSVVEPILKKYYGVLSTGASVVSIQFAMHYMFESNMQVHNFIKNVSDMTRLGGIFTGTCYNGARVYEMLQDKKQGEVYSVQRDNKIIWYIRRKYDEEEYASTEIPEGVDSVGMKISVFQETINQEFDEYLVNMKYFIEIMGHYGFEPIKEISINGKMIPGIGSFKKIHDIYDGQYAMTPEEKIISFLNEYFVFQKVRNINSSDMYSHFMGHFDTGSNIQAPVENKPPTYVKDEDISKPQKLFKRITLNI